MEHTFRRRRSVRRVMIAAGAVCAALAAVLVLAYMLLPSFFVQDVLYDNIPNKVSCSDVPPAAVAERAVDEFPTIGDASPIVVERCAGAIMEIQLADHDTREDVESYLQQTGKFEESTGWWWHSVPVEIRNV